MRDPRCWREVLIRVGMTSGLAAIASLILHADPWIWVFPVITAVMVLAKWKFQPREGDGKKEDDEGDPSAHNLS